MSRIGKLPVIVPDKVKVSIDGRTVRVTGPRGELAAELPEHVDVRLQGNQVDVGRADDSRPARSAHGLARTLVANMVIGVSDGFTRKLLIQGVGYRSEMRGDRFLLFQLGYSHPILFELPVGISAEVNTKENSVTLTGANKETLGVVAAEIRGLRPPEPYKGKGVRYADEVIKLKEGKSGA